MRDGVARDATFGTRTGGAWSSGLLLRGCLRRHFLEAPAAAIWRNLLLPIAVVVYFSLIGPDALGSDGWVSVAVAGAVWLLFANSVNYGGMVLWHERALLRNVDIPAWLLLLPAATVPIFIFIFHLSVAGLALRISPPPHGVALGDVLFGGGIAAALGLGVGILGARIASFWPGFVSVLPKILLASLLLTPVFFRPPALGALAGAWCLANPLCVATELGRSGFSISPEGLTEHARTVASAISGGLLFWALLTLRTRPFRWPRDSHA